MFVKSRFFYAFSNGLIVTIYLVVDSGGGLSIYWVLIGSGPGWLFWVQGVVVLVGSAVVLLGPVVVRLGNVVVLVVVVNVGLKYRLLLILLGQTHTNSAFLTDLICMKVNVM